MKVVRYFTYSCLLLATLFVATSCTKKRKTDAQTTAKGIVLDSLVLDKEIPLFEGRKEPFSKLSIHFTFPKSIDGDSVLLKHFQSEFVIAAFGDTYAKLSPKQALYYFAKDYERNYIGNVVDEYNKIKKAGVKMDNWGNTYLLMRSHVLPSKTGVLSFKTYTEDFNGGAHGSHRTSYFNLDVQTGKMLRESDIFKTGYEKELDKILIAQLLQDNGVSKVDELIEKGYFDLTDLKSNKNFLVTKDGIQYGFNEYEVAPYYMGLVTVSIPNSKLLTILRKQHE